MKKITIPLEFFIQLEDNYAKSDKKCTMLTKEDVVINANKKYFNHIGIA